MAKRSVPERPRPADLRPDDIRRAIPKLRRRIEDIEALDPASVNERSDPRIDALKKKIDDTLVEVFGNDTADYQRFRILELDTASHNLCYPTPIDEVRAGLHRGLAKAKATLSTVLDLLTEKLADGGEGPATRALQGLSSLSLHPEIARAVSRLFHDGHYANAVEDACKVLDGLVRIRSGRLELSGTTLMQTTFSPNGPMLRFNALANETDKSEQQGMMYLYSGTMLAFRNPRAHAIIQDDPEMALEIIGFINHLAKALDRAQSP